MKSKFMKISNQVNQGGTENNEEQNGQVPIDVDETTSKESPKSNYENESTQDKNIVQRHAGCFAMDTNCRQFRRLSAAFIDLANVEIDPNPFDQSLNAAERFLKASLTAYTELLGIDQVCLKMFEIYFQNQNFKLYSLFR